MLWFGGAEPERDIYIDDQPAKNYLSVSENTALVLRSLRMSLRTRSRKP